MNSDEINLRDKDLAVLQAIHNGASTTSEIKEETTLTLREINYSINEYSLEQLNLIEVERPEGREQKEIDGSQRTIWKPKQVQLTDQGLQKITQHETDNAAKYEDMSRRELIEQVQELENRLNRLETVFKDFRNKTMEQI